MWVVVQTLIEPNKFNVYFFPEGYLRTSSNEYDINSDDIMTHLTNNCLQVKDKATFGAHEAGNTVSFELFQKYLDDKYPEYDVQIKDAFLPAMKDIVIDTIQSTKKDLNQKQRKFCWELLGYDFLIDEDLRTWLLEVNNNPFLGN